MSEKSKGKTLYEHSGYARSKWRPFYNGFLPCETASRPFFDPMFAYQEQSSDYWFYFSSTSILGTWGAASGIYDSGEIHLLLKINLLIIWLFLFIFIDLIIRNCFPKEDKIKILGLQCWAKPRNDGKTLRGVGKVLLGHQIDCSPVSLSVFLTAYPLLCLLFLFLPLASVFEFSALLSSATSTWLLAPFPHC